MRSGALLLPPMPSSRADGKATEHPQKTTATSSVIGKMTSVSSHLLKGVRYSLLDAPQRSSSTQKKAHHVAPISTSPLSEIGVAAADSNLSSPPPASSSSSCYRPVSQPTTLMVSSPKNNNADDADNSDAEEERTMRRSMRQHKHFTGIPLVDDDIAQPAKALRSLLAFEMSVGEKVAFEDFIRAGRSKATPALIVGYFKHFMCNNSRLAQDVRVLPLSAIESVVGKLSRSNLLNPVHFAHLVLDPLLGKHRYLEQDMLSMFDFFDSDSDGEIDFRDVCNGFVLLRSRDGPVVPVVHRCIMLVAPKARREAKLAMMTRLELLHLTTVLTSVLHDFAENARTQTQQLRASIMKEVPPLAPKSLEMTQLRAQEHDVKVLTILEREVQREVQRMLVEFACDRRGNFPYNEVRQFMLQSLPIRNAVSLMRVPRDEDLYRSFLSEYYRNADVDEASTIREFRPSMRNKTVLLCGLQSAKGGMMARRQTFAVTNDAEGGEDPVIIQEDRVAVEHDAPRYYTMRGMLYRKDTSDNAPSFLTKAEYFVEDEFGHRLKRF